MAADREHNGIRRSDGAVVKLRRRARWAFIGIRNRHDYVLVSGHPQFSTLGVGSREPPAFIHHHFVVLGVGRADVVGGLRIG